jgi:hypothetical protein
MDTFAAAQTPKSLQTELQKPQRKKEVCGIFFRKERFPAKRTPSEQSTQYVRQPFKTRNDGTEMKIR